MKIKKNVTLSEQLQTPKTKSISLTRIYMTAHFPCLVQALHQDVVELSYFYGPQTSLLSEMMRS